MQSVLCIKVFGFDSCWFRSDNRIGIAMNGTIYHERQVKELCALHALNNLFQECNAFTKSELDGICYSLSPNVWINPHKSFLGLGNYDINVIMAALQRKGCEAIWFDKRKDPKCLNLINILGFILNVPSDYKLGFVLLPLRRRHWITIRQINGDYYNLDSKLESPQLIGKAPDLIAYLQEQLECKEKELFVVVSTEVEENQGWLVNSATAIDGLSVCTNSGVKDDEQDPIFNPLIKMCSIPNNVAGGSSRTIVPSAKENLQINIHDKTKSNNCEIISQHAFCNLKPVASNSIENEER
ncbi:hypothetical protein R5R35_012641 [Gryllus longicercus]|uniref:Josephin-2 n=1 Tax=Gryllus longicercus TaxID=2509291 RepID=A0AAN9V4J1_9ORTH